MQGWVDLVRVKVREGGGQMYTMVISGGSGDWGFGGDLSGRQISYIRAKAVDSEITMLPAGAARENLNGVTTRLSGSSPGVSYSAGRRWVLAGGLSACT